MESSYNRFKFNYISFCCTVRGMRVAIDTIVVIPKLHNQTATKKFRCSDKIYRDARLWPQDTKWIKWKNVRRKRANSSLVHFDGIRLLRNNLCGEKWFILYSSSSTLDLTQFSLDKILHNHCTINAATESMCLAASVPCVFSMGWVISFLNQTLFSRFTVVLMESLFQPAWTHSTEWFTLVACELFTFIGAQFWHWIFHCFFFSFFQFLLLFFHLIFFVFWYNITLKNVCAASQIYWGRLTLSCKW